MPKSSKNKENIPRSGCISNMFRVKKCLFDQSLSSPDKKLSSPNSGQQQCLAGSPMVVSPPPFSEDSPYSLFKVKKKKSILKSSVSSSCLDYTANGSIVTTPTNKKYEQKEVKDATSFQQSPNTVKIAVQKSILDPNLTGNFSKHCILPTIQGRHPDLKTVSPELVASLLQGSVTFNYTLIDCRYPYEFNGGHIKNAENIFMKEDIIKRLSNVTATTERKECKEILIFYCEFSSERGPSMLRHLRNMDRDMNRDFYPFLYYPELYVMEGGYKAFFFNFKELCVPQDYKRMLDKDCADQLAFYKSKCKSSTRSTKRLKRTRSSLVF